MKDAQRDEAIEALAVIIEEQCSGWVEELLSARDDESVYSLLCDFIRKEVEADLQPFGKSDKCRIEAVRDAVDLIIFNHADEFIDAKPAVIRPQAVTDDLFDGQLDEDALELIVTI